MRKFLYSISVMLFIVNLMISSILGLSFRRPYYAHMYHRLDTAQTIGITSDELHQATDVLLDYIKGERDTLDMTVVVNGRTVEMFNQREKDHMVDVKNLYQNVLVFQRVCLILISTMLLVSLGVGDYLNLKLNRECLKNALSMIAVLVVVLGFYALIDFNGFWIQFHELVFTNDLWLLDPSRDRLIMMVPEPFFKGLVHRIILSLGGILTVCISIYYWLDRRVKRYDSHRTV
ncbi:TIGR01906 family membrane protein [Erysipelothrix sp. HDW6A]|uniref:TIGR01906 family membrane protein n=1 Tax=Erysipelothrix sp. HDW6A TaxID=2714928 RepID=UPI001408361B|nr:TIGR01906 family membrane protein [Erysipelothrix sp. HDW6A]QIK57363.1 TIGR01906 family membrane protein [Erysipelothrix sp. HDW6A]